MSAKRWIADYERGELPVSELIGKLAERLEQVEQQAARLERDNERLRTRLAQYEPEVASEKPADDPPASRYSVDVLEKQARRKRRKKLKDKQRRGRQRTALKFEAATKIERIVPAAAPADQLRLKQRRVAWRLIDGKAVLVGYEIYDAPGHEPPPIAGLPPRSEFGLEISVVLAFLVYTIGISLDKARELMQFFCELQLSKSQADLLLSRLAREWTDAFDALCELLVQAAVIYTDETGWKIGTQGCSLWLFACEQARVFLFGCRKDAATLDRMLPPDAFTGCVVSDDAAVYTDRFVKGQKCWAHLLRKAIRLALLYPRRTRYRQFADDLLAIYRDAKRATEDGRLGDDGRRRRRDALENRLGDLLAQFPETLPASASPPERDFFNLVSELRRLLAADELFTFVTEPGVEGTNNKSERELRSSALDRDANRTSKSEWGAQRRSVIVSVLQSLRQSLETFSLASVLQEVAQWMANGVSCFREALPTAALDTT